VKLSGPFPTRCRIIRGEGAAAPPWLTGRQQAVAWLDLV